MMYMNYDYKELICLLEIYDFCVEALLVLL